MSRYNPKQYTADERNAAVAQFAEKIIYSPRYSDDEWEYRHVIVPRQLIRFVPPGICDEYVWRALGIRQSMGWEMYMRHEPEPHVLLFRRPKDYDAKHQPFGSNSALTNRQFNFAGQ